MKSEHIIKAIKTLSPNAEFSFDDEDLATLVMTNDAQKPSDEDILRIVAEIELAESKAEESMAIARQSAMNKLAELGFTDQEIAALPR